MSEMSVPGFNANLPTPKFGAGSGDFAADSLSLDMDLNRNGSMMCAILLTSSTIQASTLDDAIKQVLVSPPLIVEEAEAMVEKGSEQFPNHLRDRRFRKAALQKMTSS